MAQGSIVFSGNRQVIQHDTGGVIKNILVKDGDIVTEGQSLIELNPTQVTASLNIVLSQLRTTTAVELRLIAEEVGRDKVDFTSDYLDIGEPEVERLIANQKQLFEIRRDMLKGKLDSMNQQIEQTQEKSIGERGQLKSIQSQLASAKANANDAENLFKKGAVNKIYLMQAKSQLQQLEGEESRIKASIAMTEKSVIDGKIQLLNVKNDFMNRIEEEYKQNHIMLLEAEQKYLHAKEMMERTTIKSPLSGVVSSLSYHTLGGVISPGVKIMEINPQDDDLIIDA
jgi:HlyD family secretion protein